MLDCNPGTKLDNSSTPLMFAFFNLSPVNASTEIETSCKFSERFFAVTTTSSIVSAAKIDIENKPENKIVKIDFLFIAHSPLLCHIRSSIYLLKITNKENNVPPRQVFFI